MLWLYLTAGANVKILLVTAISTAPAHVVTLPWIPARAHILILGLKIYSRWYEVCVLNFLKFLNLSDIITCVLIVTLQMTARFFLKLWNTEIRILPIFRLDRKFFIQTWSFFASIKTFFNRIKASNKSYEFYAKWFCDGRQPVWTHERRYRKRFHSLWQSSQRKGSLLKEPLIETWLKISD